MSSLLEEPAEEEEFNNMWRRPSKTDSITIVLVWDEDTEADRGYEYNSSTSSDINIPWFEIEASIVVTKED